MKAIELTAEHIKKIWEMCQVLFPEIDIESIDDGIILGQNTYIHWFEFCMIHLAPKVCESEGIVIKFNTIENPTDFLYEQFKKLKQ